MKRAIKTKFGTLYVESGVGFGYNLYDSKKETIQSYDNDMPVRWSKSLKQCKTLQTFFDTLYHLIGDCFLCWGKSLNAIHKELKQEKGYEDIAKEEIEKTTFRIGNYLVYVNYWGE